MPSLLFYRPSSKTPSRASSKGETVKFTSGDLNDFYYRNLDKKQTAFILLLDTAKAFDSIDHLYIMVTLVESRQGQWTSM